MTSASLLLASGDRAGWRSAIAALLDRFGGTINALTANRSPGPVSLGPDATADPGVPRPAGRGWPSRRQRSATRPDDLNTLGAALYRAGRFDEAIRRLEESIRLPGGESRPEDWAFLAMAHHRLGHRDEARPLARPAAGSSAQHGPDPVLDELEIRLLRSEAEAVILYDPVFPADPFAH